MKTLNELKDRLFEFERQLSEHIMFRHFTLKDYKTQNSVWKEQIESANDFNTPYWQHVNILVGNLTKKDNERDEKMIEELNSIFNESITSNLDLFNRYWTNVKILLETSNTIIQPIIESGDYIIDTESSQEKTVEMMRELQTMMHTSNIGYIGIEKRLISMVYETFKTIDRYLYKSNDFEYSKRLVFGIKDEDHIKLAKDYLIATYEYYSAYLSEYLSDTINRSANKYKETYEDYSIEMYNNIMDLVYDLENEQLRSLSIGNSSVVFIDNSLKYLAPLVRRLERIKTPINSHNRLIELKELKCEIEDPEEKVKYGLALKEELEKLSEKSLLPNFCLFLYYSCKANILSLKGEKEIREYFNKVGLTASTAYTKYYSPFLGKEAKHKEFRKKRFEKFCELEPFSFFSKCPELHDIAKLDTSL